MNIWTNQNGTLKSYQKNQHTFYIGSQARILFFHWNIFMFIYCNYLLQNILLQVEADKVDWKALQLWCKSIHSVHTTEQWGQTVYAVKLKLGAIGIVSKGQLILKCPFGIIKSPKKPTIFFQDFCPSL